MMKQLANRMVQWQIGKSYLAEKDRALYEYSYLLLICQILNLAAAVMIGLYFHDLVAVVLFLLLFIPVRTFAGGIHADSPELCAVVSAIILCGVCLLNRLTLTGTQQLVGILITVAAEIMIWFLAPVEDHNKPLDTVEIKRYRIRARAILMAEAAVFFLGVVLNWGKYNMAVMACHIILALILVLGKIKNANI